MCHATGLFEKVFMKKALFFISFLFFGTAVFASEKEVESRENLLNFSGMTISLPKNSAENNKNIAKEVAPKRRSSKERRDLFNQLNLKNEDIPNYNLFSDSSSMKDNRSHIKRIEIESPEKIIYILARFESAKQKESYLDHGFSIRTIYTSGSIKVEQA